MSNEEQSPKEPAGLGLHNHGRAAEYAQEQGWGTNEEERTKPGENPSAVSGGTNYNYGSQDFGDMPVKEANVEPAPEAVEFLTGKGKQDESKKGA
jgi:hypothetical protein